MPAVITSEHNPTPQKRRVRVRYTQEFVVPIEKFGIDDYILEEIEEEGGQNPLTFVGVEAVEEIDNADQLVLYLGKMVEGLPYIADVSAYLHEHELLYSGEEEAWSVEFDVLPLGE